MRRKKKTNTKITPQLIQALQVVIERGGLTVRAAARALGVGMSTADIIKRASFDHEKYLEIIRNYSAKKMALAAPPPAVPMPEVPEPQSEDQPNGISHATLDDLLAESRKQTEFLETMVGWMRNAR